MLHHHRSPLLEFHCLAVDTTTRWLGPGDQPVTNFLAGDEAVQPSTATASEIAIQDIAKRRTVLDRRPCGARGFLDPGDAVLHQCIRPLIGACAPGHHGYQRACDLISGQASNGAKWVTSIRMRREDRSSIVVSSSRRPRRV